MIKDLNINGIIHAKYTIDKNILYLNVIHKFFKKNETETEQICISIIRIIEEEKFNMVTYLNV